MTCRRWTVRTPDTAIRRRGPAPCIDAAGLGSLQDTPVAFEVAAIEVCGQVLGDRPGEPGLFRAVQDHGAAGPPVEHGPAVFVPARVELNRHLERSGLA